MKRNTHGTTDSLDLVGKEDPETGEIVPLTDEDLLELVRRDPKTGEPDPEALAQLKRERAAMWVTGPNRLSRCAELSLTLQRTEA